MRFLGALLLAVALPAAAGPSAVATFHSLGLYWSPQGGSESNAARVEFREKGGGDWRRGLDLWFDARDGEYRGSLVELEPGTAYEVKLTLSSGSTATLVARTWRENFPIRKTIQVPQGSQRLVIEAEDSGDEKGYVVFTAPPGRNVIEGNDTDESCVVVRQGAHHVIVRGLVLRNCKRWGVLIERERRARDAQTPAQTRDIVIEGNEISGWGGFENNKPGARLADLDAAIYCNYYRETDDARRPDRIIVQGNRIRDPRHGSNPWRSAEHGHLHPYGPLGVRYMHCGRNHVVRYNDIYSKNGNHYMDGIGGGDNFSAAGFPWADSDIYANRISEVYDDGIEAEGGNRNVRIWGNHLERVYVPIANAATTTGPLYVWRNVSQRTYDRGPFIKAGSKHPTANGGRAYYFHNTARGISTGIARSGGRLYNFVARNNLWPASRVDPADGPFDLGGKKLERIPNFNDRYARPDAGAHQSGAPQMRFGVEAYRADRPAD